jgi:hypothetical protein
VIKDYMQFSLHDLNDYMHGQLDNCDQAEIKLWPTDILQPAHDELQIYTQQPLPLSVATTSMFQHD